MASETFTELFGETLVDNTGAVFPTSSLADCDHVGVYFSAHWCGPCRSFTPVLKKLYSKFNDEGKKFQVVFASWDKDEAGFNEYFGSMPWLAVDFKTGSDKIKALGKQFKISGIPSLVLFDAKTGKVYNQNGTGAVRNDPEGKDYPWVPPTIPELLTGKFFDNKGEEFNESRFEGKHVGIYFSAHWCPPCQRFTPKLVEAYNNGLKDKMEIIFASSDNKADEYKEYFGKMPWIAMPMGDIRKEKLSELFGIRGIPALVILSPERKVVCKNAVGKVSSDPKGEDFPWAPKALTDIGVDGLDGVNGNTSLMVLADHEDAAVSLVSALDDVRNVAEEYKAAADSKDSPMEFLFFFSTSPHDAISQIRGLTKTTPKARPDVILLDIPDEGGYYLFDESKDINAANLREFLTGYKEKKLTRKQLGA